MPVEIIRDTRTFAEKRNPNPEDYYELDGYWCMNADKTEAVIEGHPDARFVLGGPGSRIPMSEAKRLGLVREPPPPPPDAIPDPAVERNQRYAEHDEKLKNAAEPPADPAKPRLRKVKQQ